MGGFLFYSIFDILMTYKIKGVLKMEIEKMDPSNINFLQEQKDGSVIFTCAQAEIEFPESFIDHDIAEIVGKDVRILGLFEIKIYDTLEDIEHNRSRNVFFKHIGKIITCPSSIKDVRRKGEDDKYINLTYKQGDAFIQNKHITVDSGVASTILNLMTSGYFPSVLNYDEIAQYWADASAYNGVSLSALSQSSMELIISELCRDPKNLARAFRHKIKDDPKTNRRNWKMINIVSLPKYSSVFSTLTSGNARNNLISIVSRLRKGETQVDSPVEDAIL